MSVSNYYALRDFGLFRTSITHISTNVDLYICSDVRSYSACRENEKCQDQLLDCKLGRGKVLSEKEQLKLQAKRKKSESAVRKCDMEYYAAAIKSERSR